MIVQGGDQTMREMGDDTTNSSLDARLWYERIEALDFPLIAAVCRERLLDAIFPRVRRRVVCGCR